MRSGGDEETLAGRERTTRNFTGHFIIDWGLPALIGSLNRGSDRQNPLDRRRNIDIAYLSLWLLRSTYLT